MLHCYYYEFFIDINFDRCTNTNFHVTATLRKYIYIFFSFFEEAIKISISNNAKYKVKTMIKSQSKNKIPFLNALFLKSGFQISRVFIANEKSTIFAHIEKKKKRKRESK